ncbi:MAG TPA: hypothetical protein VJS69_07775 [Candidatus Krumholzibacteria bacterium]|nr:hypothetical protein [Candidatus Krumholzibacteria bacterium]
MSNDFHTGLKTPWGSIFDFQISDDEKNYRLNNRLDRTKIMRLSDLHTFNLFWNGTASYSDSRVFNRSIAPGGGVQDLIINDKQGNVGSTYRRNLYGFRTDATGSAGLIQSERSFKDDQGLQEGMNGGVAYTTMGKRVTVLGRGALRSSQDRSSTVDTTFSDLGSQEDSVVTGARFQVSDSTRFNASYARYSGDRDYTDQRIGSLGTQQQGAQNVFQEHESRNTRNTTLNLTSTLFSRFNLNVTASHDEQVYDYLVQKTRFSRSVGDDFSGSINYTLPWKTIARVSFDNSSTLRDYGAQSISSLTDKSKRVALAAKQVFSKTFSIDFSGSTQLQQSFYLDPVANPRDRDQADNNLDMTIYSQPFKKVLATVAVSYGSTQFINIDASQSADNRKREVWDLRPGFTYTVTPRFSIIQAYGLTFEYTDYDFKPDQNSLDRSISFTNGLNYHLTMATTVLFEYGLYLHDSGSYLPDPVTGVRLLSITSKDRRDRTRIRADYNLNKRVAFFAENLYSRRLDLTPDDVVTATTTDGQISVGTTANYDWGAGKYLRFQVARVKRFSPFGAEGDKNYWDARSEFSYPF